MKYMKFLLALLLTIVVNFSNISQVVGGEPQKTQEMIDYIKSLDKPVELRGDYLKAVMVAYNNDFSKILEINKRRSSIDKNGKDKFSLSLFYLN